MTSPYQQSQPSSDDQRPLRDTQQLAGQSSHSSNEGRHPWYRSRGGLFWLGVSVLALGGLLAVLIPITTGGTHTAASGGSSAPGAALGANSSSGGGTAPRGTSTAKGKVISAAKLAENGGAISLPTGMQGSVTSWQSGQGGKDLVAVSSQLGTALQAAGIRQYTSMKHACTQLVGSVTTAEAGPQIPDAAMQQLYAKALAELAKGAADCRTAVSVKPDGDESDATQVDTTVLHQSISELSVGARDIFRATAEIEIASRQHR